MTPAGRSPDEPVLVDRAEAIAILGVTETTFARFRREGRCEEVSIAGRGEWYRTAQLRSVERRHVVSRKSVTIGVGTQGENPKKSAVSDKCVFFQIRAT